AAAIIFVPGSGTAGLGRVALGYGVAATAIAAIALVTRRLSGGRVPALGAALLLAICLGLLNTPLDEGVSTAQTLDTHPHVYVTDAETRGLTTGLYDGLRWLRDQGSKNDVLAVDNHSLDASGRDSRYFYYSAFAERRVFLESWDYTPDAIDLGY